MRACGGLRTHLSFYSTLITLRPTEERILQVCTPSGYARFTQQPIPPFRLGVNARGAPSRCAQRVAWYLRLTSTTITRRPTRDRLQSPISYLTTLHPFAKDSNARKKQERSI